MSKKSRSQGMRQREKRKGALFEMFSEYQNELDTRNETQEKIYKCARDVIIDSKKVIFCLQRCARSEEWEAILSEAEGKIEEIKNKIVEIRTHMGDADQHMFQRAYDFGIEEFIEALGFYWFLKMGTLPSLCQIRDEINTPIDSLAQLNVDPTVYVFGLADVAGEIMRFATCSIDPTTKAVSFMRQLMSCYSSLQDKGLIYRSKNMSQKVNVMMASLTKVEHLSYRIKIRQLEFGAGNEQMLKEMLRRDLTAKTIDPGFSEE